MPIRTEREYRAMPILMRAKEKRIDSEFYVEGFATTFNDPYVLWEYDGVEYKEIIAPNALQGADMTDVLFQYNHGGRVYARTKMKQGKKPTLILEPQERGLFVACDLGTTEESRKMYEDIDAGLIYQMSWAFTVEEDAYNRDTHTRTITKIKKVYDVSAVDLPANPSTDISSRSWVNGVIEQEKQEFAERQKQIQRIKILTEVVKC
jgi:hypothetical protein